MFKILLVVLSFGFAFASENYLKVDNQDCKIFFSGPIPSNENYKVYWDGDCKDGYADGLGREISSEGLQYIAIYGNGVPKYYYSTSGKEEFVGNILSHDDSSGIGKHGDRIYCSESSRIGGTYINCKDIKFLSDKNKKILKANIAKIYVDAKEGLEVLKAYQARICNDNKYYRNKNMKGAMSRSNYYKICKAGNDLEAGLNEVAKYLDKDNK